METPRNRYLSGVASLRSRSGYLQIAMLQYWRMVVVMLFVLSCPITALAHAEKPKHGGRIVEVADLHVEIVIKSGQAMVFVSDHGKPVGLSGASGRLILVGKDGKQEMTLFVNPQASAFEGQIPPSFKAGDKGVVVISLAGRKPIQARFVMN